MSLAKNKSGIEIPDRMRNKLEKFQKRVWIIKLAEGLLAAAFGLLVSYLLVFTLDRFFDTSAFLRAAILIVGALGLGVWFPLVCHKWIWKSRRLEQVAKLLKFKFPRLGDHLLGIIELVNNDEESLRSEALTRAALAQVDEETKNRDFSNAVPAPKHVRWALIAGIPAVVALAALVMVPAAGGNALMRWLMPWKHTDRYTFAQIENLPNSIVVPIAENDSLRARLTNETQWTPNSGTAYVDGTSLTANHEEGEYGFTLPPFKEEGDIKVRIGDIRETVKVQPMSRPELSSLIANIKLPDYLERVALVRKDIRGGVVSTVEGSEISFIGTTSREIAEATADGNPIKVIGKEILTSAYPVDDSRVMEFQWKDTLGLTTKRPMQLKIRSNLDKEPSLRCLQLEQKQVVQEKDVLSFEVIASDDFGIKTIGMEWQGKVGKQANYESASGEKIVSAGSPVASELSAVATFSPERLDVKPQVINLRLFTQDYLPNRERVYSPTYSIYVLSEADHANWITGKIDSFYKDTLETYEQEVLNNETNKRLHKLSPEELDRAEVRNQIKAQAMAEQTNARRLDALTELGKELAKEASRNDQFDADTVEKLAAMVQKLDQISKERMPSVAKLLKKAADAPGAPGQPQSGQPGQPQEGQPQSGQPQQGQPQEGQPKDSEPGEGSKGSESPPSVKDDQSSRSGGGPGSKPEDEENKEEQPQAPSISIQESSMDKPPEQEEGEDKEAPAGSTPPPSLTLPGVTLQDNSEKEEEEPGEEQSPAAPAEKQLDKAIEVQEDLLIEFQKVAEEMQNIVQNLEGSTFVKRFKAMARRHLELAQDVNDMTLDEFGNRESEMQKTTQQRSQILAERELFHATTTSNIQDDLEAFSNRIEDAKFKTILEEMKNEEILNQLSEVSDKILSNESGGSIAHAEMLADTFDRYAEQLVGPPQEAEGEPQEGEGEGAILPPEIILEVMKILAKEISLREETRAVEQARPQLKLKKFTKDAYGLGDTQQELFDRTNAVVEAINELENASSFDNELQMLQAAAAVMDEAVDILIKPETGPEAIGAETEVIELMLQASRSPASGGGSPGSNSSTPSNGNRSGVAGNLSPLALLGQAEEEESKTVERSVEQTTGKSGEEVPAEFRYGMDKYFEALEKSR